MKKKHLYYVDYLRILLTILVIFHHTSISYGGSGSWYYIENNGAEFTPTVGMLSLFTGVNQAFFMGFFFLISGYFTPSSYNRKGAIQFLKDRLIRLGTPLVIYVFLIGPLLVYLLIGKEFQSFWHFYYSQILTFRIIEWGPLWFVESLLIFSILYVIFRKWIHALRFGLKSQKLAFPTNRKIFFFAILIGCVSFFIRLVMPTGEQVLGLQLGYFSSYIFLFIIGIMAYRNDWFQSLSVQTARTWFKVSLWFIPVLPISVVSSEILALQNTDLNGGLNLLAFMYSFWEPFVAFGIIMYLIVWFRDRFNKQIPWLKILANTAYTVYIIHPPVVVGCSILIRNVTLPWMLKFILVGLMATLICFVISHLIRKIPYFDRVL